MASCHSTSSGPLLGQPPVPDPIPRAGPSPRLHSIQTHQLVVGFLSASTPQPGLHLRDSRDHEEDFLRNMRQCWHELAPLAQLVGCLAVWTPPASVQHRHGVFPKPWRDWVSSWKLPSEASDQASQIRPHGIFPIPNSALCQTVVSRTGHFLRP